jgi:hypothetical protein
VAAVAHELDEGTTTMVLRSASLSGQERDKARVRE